MEPVKIILTGATGMVGEGVLLECLQNGLVAEVLMVNRRHSGIAHPRLKELLVPDFSGIEAFAGRLKGYDACFYCAGKSSIGMTEEAYTKLTYDTTIHFAKIAKQENPGLVFNFVSGAHTDGTEKGRVMWARVKGRTENKLTEMFPGKAYHFRPALMKPMPGQRNFHGYNRLANTLLYPLLSLFFPACSLQEVARAMISTARNGYPRAVLEVKDIKEAAGKI